MKLLAKIKDEQLKKLFLNEYKILKKCGFSTQESNKILKKFIKNHLTYYYI